MKGRQTTVAYLLAPGGRLRKAFANPAGSPAAGPRSGSDGLAQPAARRQKVGDRRLVPHHGKNNEVPVMGN